MGRDKCLLDIEGRPLILHLMEQLLPHFDQILVSANITDGFPPLPVETVADALPDKGPLMGVLSCMKHATRDLCFVQACDIPTPNIHLIRQLLEKASEGFDAVVPEYPRGQLEPLFAVYHKRLIPVLEKVLKEEGGAMRKVTQHCHAYRFPLERQIIWNLNTPEEYLRFIKTSRP